MVMSDNQADGTLRNLEASGLYAYHITGHRVSASFGVQLTYRQRTLDWDKLVFGDQISVGEGFIRPTQEVNRSDRANMVDFSAGGLLYNKTFYVGFSAHHLNNTQ